MSPSAGKLLVVASNFPPVNSAGVHRTLRFVRYLAEFGWKIDVLTMKEKCYADVPLDDHLLTQVPSGVTIHRTAAIYPMRWWAKARSLRKSDRPVRKVSDVKNFGAAQAHGGSWFERLKDSISLSVQTPDDHIGWMPFAIRRGQRIIATNRTDAIYSSGPPWTNHLIGEKLARRSGLPWIADFRDPWLNAAFKPIRDSDTRIGRTHRELERRVAVTATRIVLNTNRSADDFRSRYDSEIAAKTLVIPNGFLPEDYGEETESCPNDKLTIAHAGSFYGSRNVSALILAVSKLCRDGVLPRDGVCFQLIGALSKHRTVESDLVRQEGLNDVFQLTERVPHDDCLAMLKQADLLLLVQVGAPLCVPGKVYEYLALRKPILALTEDGATRDLVVAEGLGACVDPNDEAAIADSVVALYDKWKAGTLTAPADETRAKFDGRSLTNELHELLCAETICRDKRRHA